MDDEGNTQRRTIKMITRGGVEEEFEIITEILPANREPTEEDRRLWRAARVVIGMIAEMMGLPGPSTPGPSTPPLREGKGSGREGKRKEKGGKNGGKQGDAS